MITYVLQRRYQTELTGKVGGALGRIFEHLADSELSLHEEVTHLEAPNKLTRKQITHICAEMLRQTKEGGDTETISFDIVPLAESIGAAQ